MADPARVEEIRAVPVRHWGRWVGAAAILAAVAWVIQTAAASPNIEWPVVTEFLFNSLILQGLVNTVFLTVIAQGTGIVLGVLFAVMRLSRNSVLQVVSGAYVWLFRGTPVLVQLLFWFNLGLVFPNLTIAVPFVDLVLVSMPMNDFMTPLMAAYLGLGLNEGAYMTEIVRGGILSVDEGQFEAAHSLGMRPGLTMRRIVLPQAMRVVIPATGNEFISMLKYTSLASVVLYGELTRHAQDIYSSNLKPLELLFTISIWYLVLTTIASIGQYYIERRFARGTARAQAETLWQRIVRNLFAMRRGSVQR